VPNVVDAGADAAITESSEPKSSRIPPELAQVFALRPSAVPRLYATIRLAGPISATRGGRALVSGDGRPVRFPVQVTDADAAGSPPIPRVVCDSQNARVAIYIPRASLATVAVREARVYATRDLAQTPGPFAGMSYLRLAPGMEVESDEGTDVPLVRRVRVQELLLKGSGFVDASAIGYAYEPSFLTHEDVPGDVDLRPGARFFATPGGVELAVLERPIEGLSVPGETHVARKIGPTSAGYVLLEFPGENVSAIGWVTQKDFAPRKPRAGRIGPSIGYGSGTTGPTPVHLRRGTLLFADGSTDPIGIVTRAADFRCLGDCTTKTPLAEVWVCTGAAGLRARL